MNLLIKIVAIPQPLFSTLMDSWIFAFNGAHVPFLPCTGSQPQGHKRFHFGHKKISTHLVVPTTLCLLSCFPRCLVSPRFSALGYPSDKLHSSNNDIAAGNSENKVPRIIKKNCFCRRLHQTKLWRLLTTEIVVFQYFLGHHRWCRHQKCRLR
jgi:hypothetical protein